MTMGSRFQQGDRVMFLHWGTVVYRHERDGWVNILADEEPRERTVQANAVWGDVDDAPRRPPDVLAGESSDEEPSITPEPVGMSDVVIVLRDVLAVLRVLASRTDATVKMHTHDPLAARISALEGILAQGDMVEEPSPAADPELAPGDAVFISVIHDDDFIPITCSTEPGTIARRQGDALWVAYPHGTYRVNVGSVTRVTDAQRTHWTAAGTIAHATPGNVKHAIDTYVEMAKDTESGVKAATLESLHQTGANIGAAVRDVLDGLSSMAAGYHQSVHSGVKAGEVIAAPDGSLEYEQDAEPESYVLGRDERRALLKTLEGVSSSLAVMVGHHEAGRVHYAELRRTIIERDLVGMSSILTECQPLHDDEISGPSVTFPVGQDGDITFLGLMYGTRVEQRLRWSDEEDDAHTQRQWAALMSSYVRRYQQSMCDGAYTQAMERLADVAALAWASANAMMRRQPLATASWDRIRKYSASVARHGNPYGFRFAYTDAEGQRIFTNAIENIPESCMESKEVLHDR